MKLIEFYLAFKLREVNDYQLPGISNELRKCLFEARIIESGTQFRIFTDVENYPLQKRVLKVRFLCKVQTDAEPTEEELTAILEPAFQVLQAKKGFEDFEIRCN